MTKKREYRSLRDAFSQYSTGVTVVTAVNGAGKPVGLTANSFTSVSLDPPLVSWCVDKASTRYQEFIDATYFTISILSAEQQSLSNLFAVRSWDDTTFNDIDWYEGHNGVPQLTDVCARFHCKTEHLYEGGDHTIIVGLVDEYDEAPQSPLIFFQGEYRSLTVVSEN